MRSRKASSVEQRGDTSWRRLPTTAQSWFLCQERQEVKQEAGRPLYPSGALTLSPLTDYCPPPSDHHIWVWLSSIHKFRPACENYKVKKALSSYHGNLAHESPFTKGLSEDTVPASVKIYQV